MIKDIVLSFISIYFIIDLFKKCASSRLQLTAVCLTGFFVFQTKHESQIRASWGTSDYPTHTLEEWETVLELWQPYVFREPASKVQRPNKEIAKTDLVAPPN